MSSPPGRRHKRAHAEAVQGAAEPELATPRVANDRGSSVSSAETKARTRGDDDIFQGAPKTRQDLFELDKLPEDMLHHIHSLMPVQDAARAACVSSRFLRSWRCYSNLTLNWETLGWTGDKYVGKDVRMCYINIIDQILNNYSSKGMKVKMLKIDLVHCESVSVSSYLDRWLRIAVKSGINELSLSLRHSMNEKYRFPYSALFDETNTSPIQSLALSRCIFNPIETLGCFIRLKTLGLVSVHITDEGLQLLLSKSSELERLIIYSCNEIICLKIPCMLQKLKFLAVITCEKIQVVEISAPNLSTFYYNGSPVEISIRDPSQLKDVRLESFHRSSILSYGRAKLPSIAPNVERLTLRSYGEKVKIPMLHDKLLHLKNLEIKLCSRIYDIFSVVSFLDASPALESFILRVERDARIHDCVVGDDLYLRGELSYQHDRLRGVKITGFHSAKSLIKLLIHILESAPSLESLTLDTTCGYCRKPGDTSKCTASGESGQCYWMSESDLKYSKEAVKAAGRYIVGRVPSTVDFKVLEPCRRCYTGNGYIDAGGLSLVQVPI